MSGSDGAGKNIESPSVLVVDDALDMRIYLKNLLREEKRSVFAAGSGTEGMARLEKGGISVVVLDLMMPGEGGILMYRKMASHPLWRSIPVVIHSAIEASLFSYYLRMEKGMGQTLGHPFAYFEKPADPEKIKAAVASCTHLRKGEGR